jgi:hypothetical protein
MVLGATMPDHLANEMVYFKYTRMAATNLRQSHFRILLFKMLLVPKTALIILIGLDESRLIYTVVTNAVYL